MTQLLLDAQRNVERAEEQFFAVLRQQYPVGATARWSRGDRLMLGTVVSHGYRDRLRVRNGLTDKEIWIRADDLLAATRRAKGGAS